MPNYAATIDASGITAPAYDVILEGLKEDYRGIYGSDVYLEADSQDGQFVALVALGVHDANQALVALYNSFAPSGAQGAALSNQVLINGIRRQAASQSTVVVRLTGTTGTTINNGRVQDVNGHTWDLPAVVVIGGGGTVDVTATAQEEGDLAAAIGEVNIIATPTRGWQSVTNLAAAAEGNPVESDAALRRRQAISVSLPATNILDAIAAAVGNVAGMGRSQVYENDTDVADADGIPAHSIAVVTEGGDAQDIAEAIAGRKPPGIQTYGTTTREVTDSRGLPRDINFFQLTEVELTVDITIQARPGYVSTTGDKIRASLAGFISSLGIGTDSYIARLYNPAGLSGQAAVDATGLTQAALDALAATYYVTVLEQSRDGNPTTAADVPIIFNEAAEAEVVNINLTVLP